MATPGGLVTAMANAFGLSHPTVVEHDRLLLRAGLRTKGGRGRSAPQTTMRDAAHLAVSLLGSNLIQHGVSAVQRYAETAPDRNRSSPRLFAGCGLVSLESLPVAHSFVDALEALFDALASQSADALQSASMEIGLLTPGTLADLRIAGITRHASNVRYLFPDPYGRSRTPSAAELRAWAATVKAHRVESYVKVYRSVAEEGLLRLGASLRR